MELAEAEPGHAPRPQNTWLRFDGTGSEYFRIWVVNLLLTLLTLGVYSAWAKVRKARWFARHTVLLDDRFDFHGQPWRILLGRVLAIVLLVLWTHAFQIHLVLGLAVLALLCAAGPLLFASAQRFRYANTSWRGLRFGFEAPRRRVYALVLPLLLIWTSGTVFSQLGGDQKWVLGLGVLALLALPWGHARLKQMQHSNARFGAQTFEFESSVGSFYLLYLKVVGLLFVGGALAALATAAIQHLAGAGSTATAMPAVGILIGMATALTIWLFTWPYFSVRTQQLVWSRTAWGPVRFGSDMRVMALWRLALGQSLLTVLTLGLYWPFAAVALARYRISSMYIESETELPLVVLAEPAKAERHAAGDAVVDFFGLDLGW